MDDICYPLVLQPRYDPKLWGGRRLETVLGKALPTSEPIGESLESGDSATVLNGPLAGHTLGDLARQQPTALLGERGARASEPFHDFPLLAKFIDATDILSLQVHPDDAAAAPLGKRGKTEAWHIIHADPGASLITGLRTGVTIQAIREAIAAGTFEELIERQPVRAGDTLIVPAGTVHAIDAGILLYEIQENSDITYRLYDW
ncbi:MAG: class I mannose-6-phosphate isomerase, partial [Sphaerobacter sp.]|nr:class I mannose-6-phosphate isomerase [Sphaerobacter sp.]